MPVLTKYCGIVIRMLIDRTFGTHVHAFYGNSELVISLNPLRIIQGDVPPWVEKWALEWVRHHEGKLLSDWNFDVSLNTPISRQAAGHLAFAN